MNCTASVLLIYIVAKLSLPAYRVPSPKFPLTMTYNERGNTSILSTTCVEAPGLQKILD
jgi:hypothetical protein